MWLILSASHDFHAQWAFTQLQQRGLEPIEWITDQQFAYANCWEHYVDQQGCSVTFKLTDGRTIHGQQIRGVLNRLLTFSTDHFVLAKQSERLYAAQEMNAFFASWLHSLPCPVLNSPSATGLSGRWRHISEWIWLAYQAGLQTDLYQESDLTPRNLYHMQGQLSPPTPSTQTVIIIGQHVLGHSMPPMVITGCRELAQLAQTSCLEINFSVDEKERWFFSGASPLPALIETGEAGLDALATIFFGW
ncbi:MAG: hypothetical protein GY805_17225 [Chloroflexi bacterium]|nr:hypothetical protein [Chloroflexota bacterium]